MFCSHTKGRRRFLQRKNSVLRPKCSLGRGGELVKSDMGSAQKDGVLFKKLFPMTNNSEKKIKFEFTQGAVPKFTLNRFSYQYFSNPKTQII